MTFTFVSEPWHVWTDERGQCHVSDEANKRLHTFPGFSAAVNYLYIDCGLPDIGRALWKAFKAWEKRQ